MSKRWYFSNRYSTATVLRCDFFRDCLTTRCYSGEGRYRHTIYFRPIERTAFTSCKAKHTAHPNSETFYGAFKKGNRAYFKGS